MRSTKPRLTLAGMLLLVALVALGLNYMRPRVTQVVDVKQGSGVPIKNGDIAIVHYVGALADGKVFDESRSRGQPFEFEVGKGMVIRGWDVGLVGMQVGGIRRLIIPSEEGYGEAGTPPVIPPKATLHFEIELIGIKPGVAQGPKAAN
jgi:FKBP-type peptidyl-prolyl cis-trans isomerase